MDAQNELYKLYHGGRATAMIDLEIGGSNGLQGMILGASTNMDLPTVDGELLATPIERTPLTLIQVTGWDAHTQQNGKPRP